MARYLYLMCLCYLLCLLGSCTSKSSEGETGELPFNPHVEAFTSGKISRYTPVYLIFNQDIPQDKLQSDRLSKLVRIKPDIAGEFSFEKGLSSAFQWTDHQWTGFSGSGSSPESASHTPGQSAGSAVSHEHLQRTVFSLF